MSYPFGKDLKVSFFALADNEYLDLSGVSAPESIYIYQTRPSIADARDGAGSPVGAAITTWSAASDARGKIISISAIDDPDPTSGINEYTYYIAVNFRLQTLEQIQTALQALPMERMRGTQHVNKATPKSLKEIFSSIDTYASTAQQDSAITHAVEMTKSDLSLQGFDWAGIWRVDRLSILIAYRALAEIMNSLIASPGDEWQERRDSYATNYKSLLRNLAIQYDATRSGEPEPELIKTGGYLRISR